MAIEQEASTAQYSWENNLIPRWREPHMGPSQTEPSTGGERGYIQLTSRYNLSMSSSARRARASMSLYEGYREVPHPKGGAATVAD